MLLVQTTDLAPTWKWWLPPNYSSYGDDIDTAFYWIFWITMITFVIVEGALVYFCFKYKKNPARKAVYTHGNHKLEVAWTVIPAVILVALGVSASNTWAKIKNSSSPDYPKEFQTTIKITAQQFAWTVTYRGADGQLDTADDVTFPQIPQNQLIVPAEVDPEHQENVLVKLTSKDVIHSFFCPVLRLKQDAVPGYVGNMWFDVTRATRAGSDGKYFSQDAEVYEIACAELCGLGHSTMRMQMKALPRAEFDRWIAEQNAIAAKKK